MITGKPNSRAVAKTIRQRGWLIGSADTDGSSLIARKPNPRTQRSTSARYSPSSRRGLRLTIP